MKPEIINGISEHVSPVVLKIAKNRQSGSSHMIFDFEINYNYDPDIAYSSAITDLLAQSDAITELPIVSLEKFIAKSCFTCVHFRMKTCSFRSDTRRNKYKTTSGRFHGTLCDTFEMSPRTEEITEIVAIRKLCTA
jgi:hypothetical protein